MPDIGGAAGGFRIRRPRLYALARAGEFAAISSCPFFLGSRGCLEGHRHEASRQTATRESGIMRSAGLLSLAELSS
jgi:hypothetical protein